MKRFTVRRVANWSAVVAMLATAGVSSAQGLGSGEVVVGSRVISDVVVESSGEVAAEGEVVGGAVAYGGGPVASSVGRGYGQPDLFYNYYTQGYANQTNAQMYVSPQPVPPNVGHTFSTYQPLYPHEYLYWHKNRFHNYYDNGRGMNRTRVSYYGPPVRQTVSNVYWNYLRLPR